MMPPEEVLLLRELWYDYRKARRQNKGRWLSASRVAASRVRLAIPILLEAYNRWNKE